MPLTEYWTRYFSTFATLLYTDLKLPPHLMEDKSSALNTIVPSTSVTSYMSWAYYYPLSNLAVKGLQRLRRQHRSVVHRMPHCANVQEMVSDFYHEVYTTFIHIVVVAGNSPEATYMDVLIRVLLRFV